MPAGSAPALEALGASECLRLLGAGGTGHLGYTAGALPAIVPTRFALHDGRVVIPLPGRSPVAEAVRGAVVAFEVDTFGTDGGSCWSVTVVGPARIVADPRERSELDGLELFPRWPSQDRRYVSLRIGMLHGWRSVARPVRQGAG